MAILTVYEPQQHCKTSNTKLVDLKGEIHNYNWILQQPSPSDPRSNETETQQEHRIIQQHLQPAGSNQLTQASPPNSSRTHISSVPWCADRDSYIPSHEVSLHKYERIQIIWSMLSNHSKVKPEISNTKYVEISNILKLNNTIQNNP